MSTEANEIRFVVPAVPIAQPRPKATIRNGHATVYGAAKSHAIHDFKASVRLAYADLDVPMIAKPTGIAAEFVFVLPRCKQPKRLGAGRLRHVGRPDFDNLEKGVVDALTKLAWEDDSQLCDVRTIKVRASEDEQPHVEVTIRKLTA